MFLNATGLPAAAVSPKLVRVDSQKPLLQASVQLCYMGALATGDGTVISTHFLLITTLEQVAQAQRSFSTIAARYSADPTPWGEA